jgi:hypothetical protein
MNEAKYWITHVYNTYSWVFLLVSVWLFRKLAKKEQKAAYEEYSKTFWKQIGGVTLILIFNTTLDILVVVYRFD